MPAPPGDGPCAYLGVKEDPATCLGYPSAWNNCHRARPPAAVRLTYQQQYCLTAQHGQCAVFQSEKIGPLPSSMREKHVHPTRRLRGGLLVAALLAALALVSGALWYLGVPPSLAQSAPHVAGTPRLAGPDSVLNGPGSPTVPAASALDLAGLPTADTPMPSRLNSSSGGPAFGTPSPTAQIASTSTQACGHQLDEPIGVGRKFVIHRVQSGDTLEGYTAVYGTDLASIEAVNAEAVLPLRPDQIIVIPLNQKAIAGVPAFETFEVYQKDARISKVAAMVGSSDVGDFLFYNGYTYTQCLTFAGWVLAPRSQPRPTPTLNCSSPDSGSAVICYPTPTPTHKEHGN
jgi:hypothetical protein